MLCINDFLKKRDKMREFMILTTVGEKSIQRKYILDFIGLMIWKNGINIGR